MEEISKICKTCLEEINSKAKVCPHCRAPQTPFQQVIPYLPVLIILSIFLFFDSVIFTDEAEVFSSHRNELTITDSEFTLNDCCNALYVTTIGKIINTSESSWEYFKIQVDYFNEEGDLIDSVSDTDYGLVSHPGEVSTFRVQARAATTIQNYSSHQVTIMYAEDTDGWL